MFIQSPKNNKKVVTNINSYLQYRKEHLSCILSCFLFFGKKQETTKYTGFHDIAFFLIFFGKKQKGRQYKWDSMRPLKHLRHTQILVSSSLNISIASSGKRKQ